MVALFEACHQVERISLVNCEIGSGDFTFSTKLDYQISSINLSSNTCDDEDEDCFNRHKLGKLFEGVSKTTMKKTLKQVFINGDRFPTEGLAEILYRNKCFDTAVSWKYELKPMD